MLTMIDTKPAIKIDFVSGIACPWCAIGLGNLGMAIASGVLNDHQ
jgi:predicted DsbA family dithiol-disulfide isomerase